ncbi:glutamate 5-kinase [Halomonas denitrificans]|uniref:glutamate 5-kinase n=1 Tax=Halomonas TaxID=2745 RepID=UPI001C978954|nr:MULTISPECIES: glutamate 5-kinase [Halomonas]MBY6029981.1 glutamate 5-kinase [Halomonas sp. DP8Y7-1]MCA0973409.1 glutamate 5-kinase [Halomonas denitrificans]
MGLRDELQADIAEAFDEDLADAVTTFTGSRTVVSGEFDPVEGTYPETTVTYSGRGVFGGYSIREVDDQHIQRTDVKLSGVLQNELIMDADQTPATPRVDDTIDGMLVINVGQDPAEATWTIQLRRN